MGIDPQQLFERWYATPMIALESLPNGDGAFVAFGVALALYERFARWAIRTTGGKANDAALHAKLAADFGITDAEAAEFWQIMRHRMQHQAMPMQRHKGGAGLTPWLFHGGFIATATERVAEDIKKRLTSIPRGQVPREATRLIAFIDVGQAVHFWGVAALDEKFSGSVIDYGPFPPQIRPFFESKDPRPSLLDQFPGLTDRLRATCAG